ncbi:hypothetical protein C8F04DRAFT_145470 [Mycena alexandri]|uniref:Uncharacterized protein n=1 Tax=Mycena alexandri TaxID=1745969 RepID=A0AAD6T9X3_9AGAR|nr:hypothetical protein C8F04DRAFT_145470 [Mycena alexandri]
MMTRTCQCPTRSGSLDHGGDICRLPNASVKLPFLEILIHSMAPSSDHAAAEEEYRKLTTTTTGRTGKDRPCIILPETNKVASSVCLMATFGGTDPINLAKIYQEFIIPVFPHSPKVSNDPKDRKFKPQLHYVDWTGPQKDTEWIIPIPISTSAQLELWNTAHFCTDVVSKLRAVCRDKVIAWEEKVLADPEIGKEYYRDFVEKYPGTMASASTHKGISDLSAISPFLGCCW